MSGDDTKLCGANALKVAMPSRRALKGWRQDHKNLLKLNKANFNVLDKGWGNPRHKYRMGREWIESSSADKVLEGLADKKLNMTHQCVPAALKAKGVLGCSTRSGQQGEGSDSTPL